MTALNNSIHFSTSNVLQEATLRLDTKGTNLNFEKKKLNDHF